MTQDHFGIEWTTATAVYRRGGVSGVERCRAPKPRTYCIVKFEQSHQFTNFHLFWAPLGSPQLPQIQILLKYYIWPNPGQFQNWHWWNLEMKKMKYKFTKFYCKKVVETATDCIRISPFNVLTNTQKEFFENLNSWLLQDDHGLPHPPLPKAQLHVVLTHHWREQFDNFFLSVA